MKKIIIYFIIGLLIFVLTVLKWHNAYAQKDSIIYQEEPVENSDYKTKMFSWSWRSGRNSIIVTPNTVQPLHFTPDIQFYFDGKEFDRRMHKLEEEIDRIRWHFRRDIQRQLDKVRIDSIRIERDNRDSSITKIIIQKPNKKKEIILTPNEYHIITTPVPYRSEERIEVDEKSANEKKEKKEKEKQAQDKDKKYIQELENKIQELEKRLEQLERIQELEKRLEQLEKNNKQK